MKLIHSLTLTTDTALLATQPQPQDRTLVLPVLLHRGRAIRAWEIVDILSVEQFLAFESRLGPTSDHPGAGKDARDGRHNHHHHAFFSRTGGNGGTR